MKDTSESDGSLTAFSNGAEWIRADFHLHTAADGKFAYTGDSNYYANAYVGALEGAAIRLGVVTNHNKFDLQEYKTLRSAAKKRGIAILPGVELSVNDGGNGVHTLIVFSDEWISGGHDYISSFLTGAFEGKTPEQYQHENGRCSLSLLDTIKKLEAFERDFFLVFAHVEQSSGLWMELDGGRMSDLAENDFFRRRTLGFQKVRTHDGAGKNVPCRTKVKSWFKDWYPAEVEGSDPISLEEIGKGRASFLKLGELSFEALKFALFDHEHRVNVRLPEKRSLAVIHSINFQGAVLEAIEIPFSSSLNCLIGPRGNGKSAIIECLRHVLGLPAGNSDSQYKRDLVERILTPAGKVVVHASDEHGRTVRVEREASGSSSVFVDEEFRDVSPLSVLKDILYFGQKDLSTRSESFDEAFLEKLLLDRIDPMRNIEATLQESVRLAARKLKDALELSEKLEAYRKEKTELEVQLQVYVEKGIDKKLENMTDFDRERLAVIAWHDTIKQLGISLSNITPSWDIILESFPAINSKLLEPIVDEVTVARGKVDLAKESSSSAVILLREAYVIVAESLKKLEVAQQQLKADLSELQKELNAPQLNLEFFRSKKSRLEQLAKLLKEGEQKEETEQAARNKLGSSVNELHDFWRERFLERESAIRALEAELPDDIRLHTAFKGKRKAFEDFMRSTLRGSGLQSTAYEKVRDLFSDGRELYQARNELENNFSEVVSTKIKSALLENLEEFLLFRTPDETEIMYKGEALSAYSLGQRATVILHILMHLQHPVIVIDQPEDDLDNETLYSHFIRQLIERKDTTQFIFATHNPNIPVLGDADQIVVCRKELDKFLFEHGSIDFQPIQSRIVTVMEGGEDAFRKRKEIYQLWKRRK